MTHPLTDEAMHEIQGFCSGYTNRFDEDDMRAAYDKGAADKLEQVIEWLNEALFEQSTWVCFSISGIEIESLPEELAEAMRPQEDRNG